MADPSWITEPQRLKALSHPIRWRLLELITVEGTATATRCAAALGESVATCSYHLNMLAKYDYVTEAEGGQGREKPWRLVERETSIRSHGLDGEGQLAAEAASEAFVEYEFTRTRELLRSRSRETPDWQDASGLTGMSAHLTAAEAAELTAQVRALFDRFRDREADTSLRPSGSRPVRLLHSLFVLPDTPETP